MGSEVDDAVLRKTAAIMVVRPVNDAAAPEAAPKRVRKRRIALLKLIRRHQGLIQNRGDEVLLAAFGSVASAVNCAVDFQRAQANDNKAKAKSPLTYHIGIDKGVIDVARDSISGLAVGVADQLARHAQAGTICISVSVKTASEEELDFSLFPLDDLDLVEFPNPVRTFGVSLDKASLKNIGIFNVPRVPRWSWRVAMPMLAMVALLGATFWYLLLARPDVVPANPAEMSAQAPGNNSVAVLRFELLGIQRTLNTNAELDLADQERGFALGEGINVGRAAEILGVRFILHGSVQKVGSRVRVQAKLTDALSGFHVWSKKYDRRANDSTAIADAIGRAAANAIAEEK
jgi:hypothetical protein